MTKTNPEDILKSDNTLKDVKTEEVPDYGDVPMIVHHQPYTNADGVADVKTHGPMPVSEWAAYEKAHNL